MKFNLSTLRGSLTSVVAGASLKIRKRAPELCLAAGIASVTVGVVSACKATRKVDTITNDYNDFCEKCDEAIGKVCSDGSVYSEEDRDTDIRNEKIRSTIMKAKAYFPACLLIVAGLGSIIFGQKILKDRYNAALTSANLIAGAYNAYRERVKENFGEDVDAGLYKGNVMVTKDEDGNIVQINPDAKVDKIRSTSPYTYVFDESNPNFTQNNAENAAFLSRVMSYCNTKLTSNRYLFLSDVLDELGDTDCVLAGDPLGKAARLCGWVDGYGDNCVDFGYICEDFVNRAAAHEFDNMEPIAVVLDFNVVGNILEDLPASLKVGNEIYRGE